MCTRWQSKYPFHLCLSQVFGFQFMSWGEKEVLYSLFYQVNAFYYNTITQCLNNFKKASCDSSLKCHNASIFY